MRVKICGVNSPAAVDAAAASGADWIGFVFASSPRRVTPGEAAALARRAPAVKAIGLFVAPEDEEIAAALNQVNLAGLQLYADPDRAAAVRARFGLPVWRAVALGTGDPLPRETGGVDGLVIESPPPEGADRPGGHGRRLDWGRLAGWRPDFFWMLAGGLTPETVGEAIALSGAPAVDVSSGVESRPGEKDPHRIAAFIRAARRNALTGAAGPA